MTETSPFTMLTILILITVFLIFAMKYVAQIFRARSDAAIAMQTSLETGAMRAEMKAFDQRLERIEKLLREVE
ncbi:hypothetical protein [Thalassospira marina]|uniref:Uncharacterized protein n=1 Tax=Thalassospira marina TaxID=2048283 RepID=A0A2N3KXW7_9PROT|nr:hypothetical protein [Thalassospira marina]PKR55378.1 hypothetical protein COO20_04190 [Thalassospira marina]